MIMFSFPHLSLQHLRIDMISIYCIYGFILIGLIQKKLMKERIISKLLPYFKTGEFFRNKWFLISCSVPLLYLAVKYVANDNPIGGLLNSIYHLQYFILLVVTIAFLYSFRYKTKTQYLVFIGDISFPFGFLILSSNIHVGNASLHLNWGFILICVLYSLSRLTLDLTRQSNAVDRYLSIDYDTEYEKFKLFNERAELLEQIVKYIQISPLNKPIAVNVSGEWGSGKTSLINALCDKLKYDVITINLRDIDDVTSLLNMFFDKLAILFAKNRSFIGLGSAFNQYMRAAVSLIGGKTLASFTEITKTHTDFRDKKQYIEQQIRESLINEKKRRVLIIVDDIDRCSDRNILNFIYFIKEIAGLQYTATIFLCDYLKVSKVISQDYLDKFFPKKFEMTRLPYRSIINTYNSDGSQKKLRRNIQSSIAIYIERECEDNLFQFIDKGVNELNAQINDLKNTKTEKGDIESEKANNLKVASLKSSLDELMLGLGNPRKIKELYAEISDLASKYEIFYSLHFAANSDYKKYISISKSKECILFVAFIKIFYYTIYLEAQRFGFFIYMQNNENDGAINAFSSGIYAKTYHVQFYSFETQGVIEALVENKQKKNKIVYQKESSNETSVRIFLENAEMDKKSELPRSSEDILKLLLDIVAIEKKSSYNSIINDIYHKFFSYLGSINFNTNNLLYIFSVNSPNSNVLIDYVYDYYTCNYNNLDKSKAAELSRSLASYRTINMAYVFDITKSIYNLMSIFLAAKGREEELSDLLFKGVNYTSDFIKFWITLYPAYILTNDEYQDLYQIFVSVELDIKSIGIGDNSYISNECNNIYMFIESARKIRAMEIGYSQLSTSRIINTHDISELNIIDSVKTMIEFNMFLDTDNNNFLYNRFLHDVMSEYNDKIMGDDELHALKQILNYPDELDQYYTAAVQMLLLIEHRQYILKLHRILWSRLNR